MITQSCREDLLERRFGKGRANACGICFILSEEINSLLKEPKFLMVGTMRSNGRDVKFPGGKSEANEKPFETMVREVKGEVGYSHIGSGECILCIPKHRTNHWKFWFVMDQISGGPLVSTGQDKGITKPEFLSLPEINRRIIRSHRLAFETAIRYYLSRDGLFDTSFKNMCEISEDYRRLRRDIFTE